MRSKRLGQKGGSLAGGKKGAGEKQTEEIDRTVCRPEDERWDGCGLDESVLAIRVVGLALPAVSVEKASERSEKREARSGKGRRTHHGLPRAPRRVGCGGTGLPRDGSRDRLQRRGYRAETEQKSQQQRGRHRERERRRTSTTVATPAVSLSIRRAADEKEERLGEGGEDRVEGGRIRDDGHRGSSGRRKKE